MVHAIFDRQAYKRNLERFSAKISRDDFIYKLAEDLTQEMLDDFSRPFAKALLYSPLGRSNIELNSSITQAGLATYDEEDISLAADSFDLIVSTLSLHLVNDLPGALCKYYQALRPQGLFVATILGGQTFHQLRQASLKADQLVYGGVFPRVMPCIDTAVVPGLLQRAGFSVPVVSSELYTAQYQNLHDLLQDIRKIGHSNCLLSRRDGLESKSYFSTLASVYGNAPLQNDFEILTLIGSKD